MPPVSPHGCSLHQHPTLISRGSKRLIQLVSGNVCEQWGELESGLTPPLLRALKSASQEVLATPHETSCTLICFPLVFRSNCPNLVEASLRSITCTSAERSGAGSGSRCADRQVGCAGPTLGSGARARKLPLSLPTPPPPLLDWLVKDFICRDRRGSC